MNDLTVLYDNGASFTDYSRESQDYLRDNVALTYVLGDFIYIGLYKPYNALYSEVVTPATTSMSVQYYNGSWANLSVNDDTKDMTRSGFIDWEKPSDWQSTLVDTQDLFYIRLSFDGDTALTLAGLNIVFSDDQDLLKEVRDIMDFRASGDTSFIAYHTAARDQIVQTLRNGGDAKRRDQENHYRKLTKWDVLDIGEIRQAAKFLTLSKIFFDVSENDQDKSYIRYKDFLSKFGQSFKLFRLSLDKDDDGIKDDVEWQSLNEIIVSKL